MRVSSKISLNENNLKLCRQCVEIFYRKKHAKFDSRLKKSRLSSCHNS